MKNLKLGTKILGIVSIMLILLVISNGYAILKMKGIGQKI